MVQDSSVIRAPTNTRNVVSKQIYKSEHNKQIILNTTVETANIGAEEFYLEGITDFRFTGDFRRADGD